jgi:hypothetical protein
MFVELLVGKMYKRRLAAGNKAQKIRFCKWILAHRKTVHKILMNHYYSSNKQHRNSPVWAIENQHKVVQTKSQSEFSVNAECGIYDNNHSIGFYVNGGNFIGDGLLISLEISYRIHCSKVYL